MKQLFMVFIGLLVIMASSCSCSGRKIKLVPDYKDVDPRVQKYVDEYMWLSTQNNIQFYNKVTIGFKKIKDGNVIGTCTYGGFFREIDIDIDYWNNSTKAERMALIFHELTHCYCGRGHDYGENLEYPETEMARIARALQWKMRGGPRPGYWDDGCPFSLMYPVVVDDDCTLAHYAEYTAEMFDRCEAW